MAAATTLSTGPNTAAGGSLHLGKIRSSALRDNLFFSSSELSLPPSLLSSIMAAFSDGGVSSASVGRGGVTVAKLVPVIFLRLSLPTETRFFVSHYLAFCAASSLLVADLPNDGTNLCGKWPANAMNGLERKTRILSAGLSMRDRFRQGLARGRCMVVVLAS